jgi:hypothetical protein
MNQLLSSLNSPSERALREISDEIVNKCNDSDLKSFCSNVDEFIFRESKNAEKLLSFIYLVDFILFNVGTVQKVANHFSLNHLNFIIELCINNKTCFNESIKKKLLNLKQKWNKNSPIVVESKFIEQKEESKSNNNNVNILYMDPNALSFSLDKVLKTINPNTPEQTILWCGNDILYCFLCKVPVDLVFDPPSRKMKCVNACFTFDLNRQAQIAHKYCQCQLLLNNHPTEKQIQ